MESARRGASGMDAARGVKGQGWPLYAGPRSVDGMREVERSETRMQGQAFLLTFLPAGQVRLKKVSRPAGLGLRLGAYDRAAPYQDERAATTRSSLGVSLRVYISGGYRRAQKRAPMRPFIQHQIRS